MTGPSSNPSGEQCCVCGSPDVTYHNYREQPFCWPCADCQCGITPCIRQTLYRPTPATSRPRVDQLTDDMLDALHAQLEASEAATAMFKARAEQAEAAIARVRAAAHIADDHDVTDWQRGYRAATNRILAALDDTA